MQVLDFILLALATYYVAIILADDLISGPANILTRFREKAGLSYDDYGHPQAEPGSVAELLSCPYCNGVWVGLIFSITYWVLLLADGPARWLFAPLAVAGFIVLIQELKS